MSIFVTGATGFLGSYALRLLCEEHDGEIFALTRAKDAAEARNKLWRGLQLHVDYPTFERLVARVVPISGDLTAPGLGIAKVDRQRIVSDADSVLHIAASLNRKSEKACLNNNLRGTLSVVKLAREIADAHGLKRFTHVSTVAVAGQRDSEVIYEDSAIEWDRSDYDPYARTKKFCEHMVRELLPEVSKVFLRPSIVMGDSRFPDTAQFDMVRAFCVLADLPFVPLNPDARLDIVNADWVGRAIATLHQKEQPEHQIYHLSSGTRCVTVGEVARSVAKAQPGKRAPRFVPQLAGPFGGLMNLLAGSQRRNAATMVGSLMKVFLPYITYDTVFDNTRATSELGVSPVLFTDYCAGLYTFATGCDFKYPYRDIPAGAAAPATGNEAAA